MKHLRKVKVFTDGLIVIRVRWRVKHNPVPNGYRLACLNDPCVYCGKPSQTWEHIVPKKRGGKNSWENLARACRRCNTRRDIKPVLLFLVRFKGKYGTMQ